MGLFRAIKEIVSPVPSFGNTGPVKFRSMSFGTVDSLKAYLDATLGQTEDGKIIVTYDDANQIIDYFPTYFEDKVVEYCDSYDEYYLKEFSKKTTTTLAYGTVIPNMTTGLPKRVTGYLSGYGLSME